VGVLGLLCFVGAGAVGAVTVWRFAGTTFDALTFPVQVAPGLTPRLSGADAYRITLDYLARSAAEAEPGTVIPPELRTIRAVTANQAAGLDGCIPPGKGTQIVWVTTGVGTYLNLGDYLWSSTTPSPSDPRGACTYPGPAGTIVIDDATGAILGVYPDSGAAMPHPSPLVPAPSF
jgi:hypothetical protein